MGTIMSQLNKNYKNRHLNRNVFCRAFHRGAISQRCKLKG